MGGGEVRGDPGGGSHAVKAEPQLAHHNGDGGGGRDLTDGEAMAKIVHFAPPPPCLCVSVFQSLSLSLCVSLTPHSPSPTPKC